MIEKVFTIKIHPTTVHYLGLWFYYKYFIDNDYISRKEFNMNDFGGRGFDWNGNESRDSFDDYMVYKLSGSDKGSAGFGGLGGGDGCLTTIGAIAIMLAGLYFFGSCCL